MAKHKQPGAEVCRNCGYMLALHVAANLADGEFVGQYLTVCPTALYLAPGDSRKSLPALPKEIR